MTVVEILASLAKKDIRLWVEDGKLGFNAPDGAMTQEIKQQIVANKPQIIAFLSQAQASEKQSDIPRVDRNASLPLSYAQQRFWFLNQLEPESSAYNMVGALRIQGELDITALQQALNEVYRRHEILRTLYQLQDDNCQQKIQPAKAFELSIYELPEADANTSLEQQIENTALHEASQGFNLSKEVFRVSLYRINTQDHLLVSTLHHIASDGWSMGILVKELAALYQAYSQSQASPLPDLPIQYADFAHWQLQQLDDKAISEDLNYWQQQLQQVPKLALATDFPRPAIAGAAGGSVVFKLGKNQTQAIKHLAQQQGVTLFMALQAAYKVLLARYTGSDDICVGTPIAGRDHSQLEHLIGCFLNTLAIRTDLSGEPSFLELLEREKAVTQAAFKHQHTPFAQVVDAVEKQRDMSTTPLFQTLFVLQNAPVDRSISLSGIRITPLELEKNNAQFELKLSLNEADEAMIGEFEYRADLFQKTSIERMAKHFSQLLSSLCENPEQSIYHANMISPEEAQQLLQTGAGSFNDTQVDYGQPQTIHTLFEQQVSKTPEHIAVSDAHNSLTYQELEQSANRLANYLRQQGLQNEQSVAVCLQRSCQMSVALLGILKAGGCYLPCDVSLPTERLLFMLNDTGAQFIISETALSDISAALNPNSQYQLIEMDAATDSQTGQWQQQSETSPALSISSDSLFNIIYTSGSTGTPKGVMVPHQGIFNRLQWMQQEYQLQPDHRVLQKTPYSFDVSVWEFFWPLICGASLIYAKPEGHKDPEYLRDLIQTQHISHLHFVPSMLGLFLQTDGIQNCRSLKQVFCSGEALQLEHESRFLQQLSHAELHNLYGPTEASVDVSYHPCQGNHKHASVLIGKPVANTQLHILDTKLQAVPLGVPGELYIGGVQLARGYLNRDELNASTFINNPFHQTQQHPSPRLYKTGDLARWLESGEIEYIGRVDHQVKIRGLRIELGEIEAALNQIPQTGKSVVIAHNSQQGDAYLVAYIVLQTQPGNTISQTISQSDYKTLAQQTLSQTLPEYMVPQHFILLDAMPLSANGKLNRKALPIPDFSQQAAEYIAPQSELEKSLALIWQELLGIERVGLADNFFDLGGHSLLATQMLARIRQQLQCELPLKQLFAQPTLGNLANALQESLNNGLKEGAAHSTLDISALKTLRQNTQHLPLSFAQQRLWLIDQLQPGSITYNIPLAIRLTGKLNTQALQQALQTLMDENESLRTCFQRPSPKKPASQVIAEQQDFPLEQTCATSDNWQDSAKAFLSQPFDLQQGPLIRASLLELAPEQHILLISQHHIISDGWSQQRFIATLGQHYLTLESGQAITAPSHSLQYADYTLWQQQYLQGEVLEQQLAYWQQQLANNQVLELACDFSRPAIISDAGESLGFELPAELANKLRQLAQQHNATLYMTLLAAWQLLLSRLSGQSDISIGSPVAGRQLAEFEPILGFFVNTLVMRSHIKPQQSFEQLLEQVKQTALDAYQHQDIPFERLVDELKLPRDLSHTPLFQAMFTLQNEQAEQNSHQLGDLAFSPAIDEQKTQQTAVKFDLNLTITDKGDDALYGSLAYRSCLWQRRSMQQLLQRFEQLLSAIVSAPQQSVSLYPLLTPAEIEAATTHNNQVDFGSDNILDLFEQQVQQTPTAIACATAVNNSTSDTLNSSLNQTLSYQALNQQANQLARYLQQQGLNTGDKVGICLRPSNDCLLSVLAVIKAGAAYVPMDASYPVERLRHMLQNADCRLLISHSELQAQLPESTDKPILIDQLSEPLSRLDSSNLNLPIAPDALLYIIFTSGSTGLPKGAGVSHANEANLIHWYRREYQLKPQDKAFIISAFGFDLTQKNLFALLSVGGCVVFPAQAFYDPASLLQTIHSEQISLINCAPSAFYPLLDYAVQHTSYTDLASLRCLLFGGEPIKLNQMADWLQQTPCHIVNMYGPTECTDIAASYTLSEPAKALGENIPIGRANANVQLYILDQQQQLLPDGTIGELCIGGAGVGLGYINNPEQTAEKFLPNPFAPGKLYRSGDLARKRPDGNIEFISRMDNQVKVRGYRIELGEIETVLNQQSNIQQAAVIVHQGSQQNFIAAYIVHKDEAANKADKKTTGDQLALKQTLRQHLPDYMIPSVFIPLRHIPLSPNGKLDYKALPNPEQALNQRSDYQAPETELEQTLCDIWQQILGLDKVGISDNFFELGGNSLSAAQTISQVQAQFQLELELRSLFDEPNIHALGKLIEQAQQQQAVLLNQDEELGDDEEEFVL